MWIITKNVFQSAEQSLLSIYVGLLVIKTGHTALLGCRGNRKIQVLCVITTWRNT